MRANNKMKELHANHYIKFHDIKKGIYDIMEQFYGFGDRCTNATRPIGEGERRHNEPMPKQLPTWLLQLWKRHWSQKRWESWPYSQCQKCSQCLNTQRNTLDYDKLENYRSSRTFFDKEFSMNFMKFQLLWFLQMLWL